MAVVWNIISGILSLEPVQGAIVALLLLWLGRLFVKHQWTQKIVKLATDAYVYAEEQGLLQGLRGYQKWDPFFDKFVLEYQKKYGKDPPPEIRAAAVKYVEQRVINEKKQDSL